MSPSMRTAGGCWNPCESASASAPITFGASASPACMRGPARRREGRADVVSLAGLEQGSEGETRKADEEAASDSIAIARIMQDQREWGLKEHNRW